MSNLEIVFIIETVLTFLLCCAVFSLVLGVKKNPKSKVRKRHAIASFDRKSILYIVLASFGLTYLLGSISANTLTSIILFVCILTMIPYAILADRTRIQQEEIFDDVVIFCQNTAMLLKQNHNVYNALSTVQKDLNTSLKDDINQLIKAIDEGADATKDSMAVIEGNYPYTCIKNLNVIMLHMQFEDANINDDLLTIYQDDLDVLEKDVRDNKIRRKSLRLQYTLITAAAIVVYWIFLAQIKETFAEGFETTTFKLMNGGYILLTITTLFFVDRYFNSTTTKE